MAETDPAVQETPPADQQEGEPKPEEPTATPLTREEMAKVVADTKAELKAELKVDLENAYKAARRSEAKGDTAIQRIDRISAAIEELETNSLPEDQRQLHKLQRQLERERETKTVTDQQGQQEAAWKDFQARGVVRLQEEGIAGNDPRLTAAYQRYAASATSAQDWDVALNRAISEVHKDERRKAAEDGKTAADKAREEERAKTRNEKRTGEGPTDKGGPSSVGPKNWDTATDEEVNARLKEMRDARIRAGL